MYQNITKCRRLNQFVNRIVISASVFRNILRTRELNSLIFWNILLQSINSASPFLYILYISRYSLNKASAFRYQTVYYSIQTRMKECRKIMTISCFNISFRQCLLPRGFYLPFIIFILTHRRKKKKL